MAGLGLPTLIVVGERDKMTPPELSRAMAQAIPDAELKIIEGGSHMLQLEKFREANQAIAQFMGRF